MVADQDNPFPAAHDGVRVPPYTATRGRTRPSVELDLMSLVRATGSGGAQPAQLRYDHAEALRVCGTVVSVAEVAAHLQQTATVAKVLLADLIDIGAVAMQPPASDGFQNDHQLMEAVLAGLRGL